MCIRDRCRNHQQDASATEDPGKEPHVLLMIDGGAFWDIIGDNVVKYLHNVRACEPKPIVTGSGISWLNMQGDLMLRNDELKSCLINPGMPMSVISEGKLTHSGNWKTSRSKFGTMITINVGRSRQCADSSQDKASGTGPGGRRKRRLLHANLWRNRAQEGTHKLE